MIITKALTLHGGHTVSGTAWLPRTGETIIDGSNSQTVEGDWDGQLIHHVIYRTRDETRADLFLLHQSVFRLLTISARRNMSESCTAILLNSLSTKSGKHRPLSLLCWSAHLLATNCRSEYNTDGK